jgi:hypothetical protein
MHLGGIGAPHPVRTIWDDGPVMDPGTTIRAPSVRSLQTMLAHQAAVPYSDPQLDWTNSKR